MYLITEGLQTKTIADRLNISINTAECHRAKVMKKMKAKSAAHLVRLIIDNH